MRWAASSSAVTLSTNDKSSLLEASLGFEFLGKLDFVRILQSLRNRGSFSKSETWIFPLFDHSDSTDTTFLKIKIYIIRTLFRHLNNCLPLMHGVLIRHCLLRQIRVLLCS